MLQTYITYTVLSIPWYIHTVSALLTVTKISTEKKLWNQTQQHHKCAIAITSMTSPLWLLTVTAADKADNKGRAKIKPNKTSAQNQGIILTSVQCTIMVNTGHFVCEDIINVNKQIKENHKSTLSIDICTA